MIVRCWRICLKPPAGLGADTLVSQLCLAAVHKRACLMHQFMIPTSPCPSRGAAGAPYASAQLSAVRSRCCVGQVESSIESSRLRSTMLMSSSAAGDPNRKFDHLAARATAVADWLRRECVYGSDRDS